MSVREQLLHLESQFWGAAGNREFYDAHFADDGLMAFTVGIMTKPQVLAAMAGAPSWSSFTVDDPRYVEVGDDVAAIVYATEAENERGEEHRAVVTSVYVNRGGEWILVLHQQTPI